jgi:ABC-type transporter Mla subunit MlaD
MDMKELQAEVQSMRNLIAQLPNLMRRLDKAQRRERQARQRWDQAVAGTQEVIKAMAPKQDEYRARLLKLWRDAQEVAALLISNSQVINTNVRKMAIEAFQLAQAEAGMEEVESAIGGQPRSVESYTKRRDAHLNGALSRLHLEGLGFYTGDPRLDDVVDAVILPMAGKNVFDPEQPLEHLEKPA